MSENVTTHDRPRIVSTIRQLLQGMELASFKYDSGFTIHFQDVGKLKVGLPAQVSLVLRGNWRWLPRVPFPANLTIDRIEGIRSRPEQPQQAFGLMTLIGETIEHVQVGDDSSITLVFSRNHELCVAGREEEWEFSWYLFVPSDFPGVDTWSITCYSSGKLEGVWPADARISS